MKSRNIIHTVSLVSIAAVCAAIILTGCSSSGSTADSAMESASVSSSGSILDTSALFTDRDLEQTADLSDAVYYAVSDGGDIHITEAGVYVLSGAASNVTVYVEAPDEDKVQIVLDGVSITNDSLPCIHVESGDKVFVTTSADSTLSVTDTFSGDNAVIYSCSDLVLNGTAALTINSTDNGIVCEDDLKITGGTFIVTASSKAFSAEDSIRISDGAFFLNAGSDGLHAENSKDSTLGYIYIGGGSFKIQCVDDAIHAQTVAQIDGGAFDITAAEGIEATYVQINGGTLNIEATGDGINGGKKSDAYSATIEITGGDITIITAEGDTDCIDSNGDLIISGGSISVTGSSTFDYDGSATYTGGTIIVNGEQVDSIPAPSDAN